MCINQVNPIEILYKYGIADAVCQFILGTVITLFMYRQLTFQTAENSQTEREIMM